MSLLTGNVNKPSAKVIPSSREELERLIRKQIEDDVKPQPGQKVDFNWIDISKIGDLSYLFANVDYNPVVDAWLINDQSNVKKNMRCMFAYSKFNGDISEWNVSNVTDMRGMFTNSNFNGDISGWNVSNVKDMRWMFDRCPLENNPPEWYNDK